MNDKQQASAEVILVLGATGNQGGAVVEHLLCIQKEPGNAIEIRALVRSPESEAAQRMKSSGVAIVPGSMEDAVAMREALKGVTRVFLHTTHNKRKGETAALEQQRGLAVVEELASAPGLQQVIYSTLPSLGDYDEGSGKAAIEARMREQNLPLTTVLSPFYLENFLDVWPPIRKWFGLLGPLQWGWLPTDKPLRMPHASVHDFGAVVARILSLPASNYLDRHVTVVSEDLLLSEVLERLGDGIGEAILWRPIPRREFRRLPFPRVHLSGLEYYTDSLCKLEEVEQGFLQSRGKGADSLAQAAAESRRLYPAIQSIEAWARSSGGGIRRGSYRKVIVSTLLLWVHIKSLILD